MRSEDHERFRDDLAAYVLHGLSQEEASRLEHHLRQCKECSAIAREYHAVMDLLPLALPASQPTPSGLVALQQRIHAEGGNPPSRLARAVRRPWQWLPAPPPLVFWPAVIGLVIILIAAFGLWWSRPAQHPQTAVQQLRDHKDVQVVNLSSTAAAPAHGELMFTPDLAHIAVAVNDLPPLPPSRVYQVWFDRADQTWASGGVFRVDAHGNAEVIPRLSRPLSTYYGCWITEEPQGGSETPSGPLVLSAVKP